MRDAATDEREMDEGGGERERRARCEVRMHAPTLSPSPSCVRRCCRAASARSPCHLSLSLSLCLCLVPHASSSSSSPDADDVDDEKELRILDEQQ